MLKFISKKILECSFALLSVFCSANAAEYEYPKNSPVALNGKLSVKGTKMVNECGNIVQLRGMSSHGLAWYPNCYTESAIKTLVEDWGIDIFRLAIYTHSWGGYTTNQWKSKDEYNQYIDNLVEICGKYGIYCIIDWHILNDGSNNPNNTLDDAKPFWDYISKKHKDDKHVFYEICNEPNKDDVTWDVIKKYADIIIPIIRANDPNTIVICGTPTYSQDVDKVVANPLQYDNIMYTLHFYSGTHTQSLRNKGNTAINNGLALFVTEFGTSAANGSDGVFFNECDIWMQWMKEHNISWCNWSFAAKDETSAALVDKACDEQQWNNTSESGQYIKEKLLEPDEFIACNNSVEEVSYSDLIYITPNPVLDVMTITLPDNATLRNVKIMNMLGSVIMTSNEKSFSVENIAEGMYQVIITLQDGVSVKKILKR